MALDGEFDPPPSPQRRPALLSPRDERIFAVRAVTMSRPKALALVAISLALGMSTWFSATAVLPQLRALWSLSVTEAPGCEAGYEPGR